MGFAGSRVWNASLGRNKEASMFFVVSEVCGHFPTPEVRHGNAGMIDLGNVLHNFEPHVGEKEQSEVENITVTENDYY